jgi:hypothetical protein
MMLSTSATYTSGAVAGDAGASGHAAVISGEPSVNARQPIRSAGAESTATNIRLRCTFWRRYASNEGDGDAMLELSQNSRLSGLSLKSHAEP